MATRLCAAPMAQVALIEGGWVEAGRDGAGAADDLLVVPDLGRDPRTRSHPRVAGEPRLRFYAGAALRMPEGPVIGRLGVFDTAPRPQGLTAAEASGLRALARQVVGQLEIRRAIAARDAAGGSPVRRQGVREPLDPSPSGGTGEALRAAEADLRRAQEAGGIGLFSVGIDDGILVPTPEFCRLYGMPERASYPAAVFERLVIPEDRHLVSTAESRRRGEPPRDVAYRIRRPDTGAVRWIARKGEIERDAQGRPVRFVGVARDITAERQAGDALARSEQRYRALFEAIDDGFCIIEFLDGPHGPLSDYVHVEANPGYARHTGIPDIVGRRLREIAPLEADGWAELYGGVLRTGTPIRFERDFIAAGRCIEVSAARIEPPSRRQVSVLFRDITARKAAEAALRASEEQFRVFAQVVPSHVWAARPDGRLYWFNAQVHAYTGLDAGDLDGATTWGRVVHPDDLPAALAAWSRSLGSGAVYEVEFRIRRTDGVYRWFLVRAEPIRDADGAVTGWVGTNTDIEERRQQAAFLEAEVERRTRDRDRIWRLSTDVMLVADFEGRITALNPAWTSLLGWPAEAMLGENFLDLVHPEDGAATLAEVGKLAAGQTTLRFENRYRHRDGSYRWLSWTAVPHEQLIHAIGRDVQGEKEAAEALAKTEEALRQAQKMEAVGQLTGGIAHDFNNLLTGIIGSLELLSTRIAQGRLKDVERYTTAAQGAARRAAALTHRLLAFSRRQTLDPKPTDVNRLVAGMEDLIRRTVGPEVAIEVVGTAGLWPTLVDPNQLENALLNLCINARDAMPEGGRITIETANRWFEPRIARERDLEPGQYVSLCVSDTGTGMTSEVIAKAFEPFFTTKPLGEGTGLGLSMIYGFVRQSGGQVRIYSEVGQGTNVCLYLPRHLGEAPPADPSQDLAEAPRAVVGETVLVVDDEPTVRMLVGEVLEELGYAAIEAVDGASGLTILQSDVRIDLLVTDVGLPGGMNGRQMADAARVSRPDLKVLFITGYAENAVVSHGHLAPGMHVMTKPFAMEALAVRIRDLIAGP
ncbi:hybrid sensor histidine kinase/response regulator [Methylobacterium sp. ID0610]|uniref:hybrid sensor histidine kinase/response regulator n=1 Tax=Methylobacterium carpenticola TaxID=3344827 RepID=UPI0036C4E619